MAGYIPGKMPYPDWPAPSPAQCHAVHTTLATLHGLSSRPSHAPPPSLTVAGCGEVPCVHDAVLRTVISGATVMARADQAVANLSARFGVVAPGLLGAGSIDWDAVRQAPAADVAATIKCAGLADTKTKHIKAILDIAHERNGDGVSLEHLHDATFDEAMVELTALPGVGVKTAACVSLFCLRQPSFAVDTHVLRLSRWLGWVPARASMDTAFYHLNRRTPDELKYGLHQLFIRHGQECLRCRAITMESTAGWEECECPLEELLVRDKKVARGKVKVGVEAEGVDVEGVALVEEEQVVQIGDHDQTQTQTQTQALDAAVETKQEDGQDLFTNNDTKTIPAKKRPTKQAKTKTKNVPIKSVPKQTTLKMPTTKRKRDDHPPDAKEVASATNGGESNALTARELRAAKRAHLRGEVF